MDHDDYLSESYRYWPDGLTERDIDDLIARVWTRSDQEIPPTSALVDGSAARRRDRRIARRSTNALVRSLPMRRLPDDREAA